MSNIPADLRYTKSHEWVRSMGDGNVEVGITDHAQGALGDLVFVEVPEAGKALKVGDAFAVVESVKAASDVYAPIAGSDGRRSRRVDVDQPGRGYRRRVVGRRVAEELRRRVGAAETDPKDGALARSTPPSRRPVKVAIPTLDQTAQRIDTIRAIKRSQASKSSVWTCSEDSSITHPEARPRILVFATGKSGAIQVAVTSLD